MQLPLEHLQRLAVHVNVKRWVNLGKLIKYADMVL